MEIEVNWSKYSEARKLQMTLNFIAKGFYTEQGFYTLPSLDPAASSRQIIILPHLPYRSIAKDWSEFLCRKNRFGEWIITKRQVDRLIPFLESAVGLSEPRITPAWVKSVKDALMCSYVKAKSLVKYLEKRQLRIFVHPSRIGSYGSFDYCNFLKNNLPEIELHYYLRTDQSPLTIVELFVSSITFGILPSGTRWREAESISDFLTKYIFMPESGKIGAPGGKLISYNRHDGSIYYFGKPIHDRLSPYEYKLLVSLIKHGKEGADFDRLADDMYGSKADVKYSLWGIRKTVQRLKEKFRSLGLPEKIIVNVKDLGYMINT